MSAFGFLIALLTITISMETDRDQQKEGFPFRTLSARESYIILEKGTERPGSGIFNSHWKGGTYMCRQCGSALFHSSSKFDAGCGWPSFDDEIEGSIKRVPDSDGIRTEILCASCDGHLGHVFAGEGFTANNLRHCVNSLALDFVPVNLEGGRYATAIFAGGCFWGVEHFLEKEPGVMAVVSGYTGGNVDNPTYDQVCTGTTGHAEAVRVIYDPSKNSYTQLVRLFLEIHDPTQIDGQGPDIGTQYRSEIFYLNDQQREIADNQLNILRKKGYEIATRLSPAGEFFDAEEYHQDYYTRKGSLPYCHGYTKRF